MLSTALFCTPVIADDKQLPPEAISKISEYLDIDPKSPAMYDIIRDYQNTKRSTHEETEPPADPPIIQHFKGTHGIPLPPPAPPRPRVASNKDHREFFAKFREVTKQSLTRYKTVPELPDCTRAETKKRVLNEKLMRVSAGPAATIYFDTLYIRKGEAPLDPEIVIGRHTRIVEYDSSKRNGKAFTAIGLGVTCLPYRIRLTPAVEFQDLGLNALKNYDKDPQGPGELHDIVKVSQQQFKSRREEKKR